MGPAAAELFLKSSTIIAKGHKKENCWQKAKRENAKEGGKTRPSRDGGKDPGKGKGRTKKGKQRTKEKKKEKAKTRAKRRRKERVLDLQAVMGAAPSLLETRAELLL